MDLKSDNILNVDIDDIDAVLLSYELGMLRLENIPNDIFELPDTIQRSEDQVDSGSVHSRVESNEITQTSNSSEEPEKNSLIKTSITEFESCAEKLKLEAQLGKKKDINGNEESASDENLNQLFLELELSDSDNEKEDKDCCTLRERGPMRNRGHASRYQKLTKHLGRSESYDKSQFDSQKLKFWCGSNHVQSNDTTTITTNQFSLSDNLLTIINGSETVLRDSFNEDARVNLESGYLGSPESGYESSITGSPPRVSLSALGSPYLDHIAENIIEENILEFLAEKDFVLTGQNVSKCDTDDTDPERKINKIKDFLLEDTPTELRIAVPSSSNSNFVPFSNSSQDLINYCVPSLPPKTAETQKKLVYKLENRARKALREFLPNAEFRATEFKMHKKINEDIANEKEVKVIYVEDEMDKTSENRTNLHHAVLNCNVVEIFCLVEIQKQYKKPLTDINIRDKYGKTALDYAIQKEVTLVIDYLKENTACESVNIYKK